MPNPYQIAASTQNTRIKAEESAEIEFTVNAGALTDDELKGSYIYVIDEAGQVNEDGLVICGDCPLAPTALGENPTP